MKAVNRLTLINGLEASLPPAIKALTELNLRDAAAAEVSNVAIASAGGRCLGWVAGGDCRGRGIGRYCTSHRDSDDIDLNKGIRLCTDWTS